MYADIKLKSGDVLDLGETEFKFIKTPGHTSGSGCYVFEKDRIIFTGDTLFRESMGRTDFPTGDLREMHKSLMMLKSFKGDYKIFPGHNADTTLEHERKNNIYMS
ncbi:MAG: MBL fold metallo-hydrolase [Ruminococcus sp.]